MSSTEYQLKDLRVEPKMLGEGGSANIYRCKTAAGRTMVFKRYHDDKLKDLDVAALRHLIAYPAKLPEDEHRRLMRICAWPQAAVVDDGRVVGILMEEAPLKFLVRNGVPCHFEFVGVRQELAEKRNWPYYDFPHKVARLGHLLEALQFLHSHDIVVGDLQIKNVMTTRPESDSNGITAIEILLLDCDSFIVGGRAALPPMDPPNMRFPHPFNKHSVTTDLYKFALVTIRCLSETLTASTINYEKFKEILPTASFDKIDKLLTERDPGLTSADLANMAKSWKATVKKDGRLYCRTDTSISEKWTQEKRQAHLAGLTSPKPSGNARPPRTPRGTAEPKQPAQPVRKLSESAKFFPKVFEPYRPQVAGRPFAPTTKSKNLKAFAWVGVAIIVLLVIILISVNQRSSNSTSGYVSTTFVTTRSVVTATTSYPTITSMASDQISAAIKNAKVNQCVIVIDGAQKSDGTVEITTLHDTPCANHSRNSYVVTARPSSKDACHDGWAVWNSVGDILCLASNSS